VNRYPEQAKSIFQAIVLVSISDGSLDPGEIKFLKNLREKHPLFSSLQDPKALAKDIRDKLKSQGLEACLAEIATIVIDKDYRELCFRLCAEMMEADANAGGEEALALGTLQELFGFNAADVKRLLDGADLTRR
jgi:hypothetical protein